MKKLDHLDTYTRTQIKNEIATERVNYVGQQRVAIEDGLNAKINSKTSMADVKSQYDPIIDKLKKSIPGYFIECKDMY